MPSHPHAERSAHLKTSHLVPPRRSELRQLRPLPAEASAQTPPPVAEPFFCDWSPTLVLRRLSPPPPPRPAA